MVASAAFDVIVRIKVGNAVEGVFTGIEVGDAGMDVGSGVGRKVGVGAAVCSTHSHFLGGR